MNHGRSLNVCRQGLLPALCLSLVAGCGSRAVRNNSSPPDIGCTDPRTCADNNGAGVYTAEGGYAGIGPFHLMILNFRNEGSWVSFEGRYSLDPPGTPRRRWHATQERGKVVNADYLQVLHLPQGTVTRLRLGLEVRQVAETITSTMQPNEPTWTLWDSSDRRIDVSGDALRRLELHISVLITGGTRGEYILDFAGDPIPRDDPEPPKHNLAEYHMRWRLEPDPDRSPPPDPKSYCHTAEPRTPSDPSYDDTKDADTVVFQQGIRVDPTNGRVTHPASNNPVQETVTVSCSRGAPATVARWGYKYRSTTQPVDFFYFDAAIQMKRASYCADTSAYTTSGTKIRIWDSQPLPTRSDFDPTNDPDNIEAWWSPDGAICLTRMRHEELRATFSGCPRRPVPDCRQSGLPGPRRIADRPGATQGSP